MVNAFVLAVLLPGSRSLVQAGQNGMLWEERPEIQKNSEYHPMIRFSSWAITRFNRSTTYVFAAPDMAQQGQFTVQGNRYSFRAVMANELENADREKIVAEMPQGAARSFEKSYAQSMANFEGTYDPGSGALTITYPINGQPRTFELHATNEGDDQLPWTVSAEERSLVGLWEGPDPFPQRLDARTRVKIEEQGLLRFSREAAASAKAMFRVLDLRSNNRYRYHATEGTWRREGSSLLLSGEDGEMKLGISADSQKLIDGGRPAFVRT